MLNGTRNLQWYWSRSKSLGNNGLCSPGRDGVKLNNTDSLEAVTAASSIVVFWPSLHLFSVYSLNYVSAEKLFRKRNKKAQRFW